MKIVFIIKLKLTLLLLSITLFAQSQQTYVIKGKSTVSFNEQDAYSVHYISNDELVEMDNNSVYWQVDGSNNDEIIFTTISNGYPAASITWNTSGVKYLYFNGTTLNGEDIHLQLDVTVGNFPAPEFIYTEPQNCNSQGGHFYISNYNNNYSYKVILSNGDIATDIDINNSSFYAPEGTYKIEATYLSNKSYSNETEVTHNFIPPNTPSIGTIEQPNGLNLGNVELSGLPNGEWTIQPGNIKGTGNTYTVTGLKETTKFRVINENGCSSPETSDVIINFTNNENYVHTISPQIPINNVNDLNNSQKIENVQYYDGLGRPKQSVAIRAGGGNEDIVTHVAYDDFGRQTHDYLPYATSTNSGLYRDDALIATENFYNTSKYENTLNPYSEKHLEASPLGRVLEQAAPGADWALDKNNDTDHTIKFEYGTNTADEVLLYGVDLTNNFEPTLTDAVSTTETLYYNPGELYKTITKDENWTSGKTHTTEEFKNKQGQIVLKRTYADIAANGITTQEIAHDTYYVYDDYGNLTYVIPPKVDTADGISTGTDSELSELCYQYIYDERNRLIEKKTPGKGGEYIIYNKLDKPIITQDSNLKNDGESLFTKYDAFGRIVYSGLYHYSTPSQSVADNTTNQYENKSSSPINFYGVDVYYTSNAYPSYSPGCDIYTINYYDNYIDLPAGLSNTVTTFYGLTSSTKTKGLPTVSKVRVLDTNDWITTVTYYDEKSRPIYVYSKNEYLETTDIVESKFDFVGKVLKTRSRHTKGQESAIVIQDVFTYDHANRLIDQHQCIGDDTLDVNCGEESVSTHEDEPILDIPITTTEHIIANNSITLKNGFVFKATASETFTASLFEGSETGELITENEYDDLGQLISKKVGNSKETPLQTVDYDYNIRGWLTGINDTDTNNHVLDMSGNDLFGFKINYNQTTTGTALYNGNISQTLWSSLSENSTSNPVSNIYTYSYDALNRIKQAADNTTNYSVSNIDYDKNGNILTLDRKGQLANSNNFGYTDQLSYSYDVGNQLKAVTDATSNDAGFKDGDSNSEEYKYDVNGNMTKDDNKGITLIKYNHLNLPTEIQIGNSTDKIEYIYDATGAKLQKTVIASGKANVVTQYAGNHIYVNNVLEFFNQPEGYVSPETNSGAIAYKYVYQYKDHLGNVRLSYKNGTNGLEIVEENNYYPFGLKHKGYNSTVTSTNLALKKRFGGKEQQDELGLDWYDVSARNYDPALGRWMNLDPLAELMTRHSPYNYAFDNPVFFIDPDGMAPVENSGFDRDLNSGRPKQEQLDRSGIIAGNSSPNDIINIDSKSKKAHVTKTDDDFDMVSTDGGKAVKTEKGVTEARLASEGYSIFHPGGVGMGAVDGAILYLTGEIVLKWIGGGISAWWTSRAAIGSLNSFSQAGKYGIQAYGKLAKTIKGTGLEAHHLIEKRFAATLGVKIKEMSSIALTKAEHKIFTKAWRDLIPYKNSKAAVTTVNATVADIKKAAKEIYKNYPEITKSLGL